MDWMEDMHSNLWVFPRGVERNGEAGPNSITWAVKYGSVIVSGYEVGTADGIFECGSLYSCQSAELFASKLFQTIVSHKRKTLLKF